MSTIRLPASFVSRWPVLALPRPLLIYVFIVPVAALVAIGIAVSELTFRLTDLALFAALLGCASIAVEAIRHIQEPQGTRVKDFHSVWCLPIALLLPPAYALIAPIFLIAHVNLRIQRGLLYRRVFSAASISLALGAASATFHAFPAVLEGTESARGGDHALTWSVAVLMCAIISWFVNMGLIVLAITGFDPEARLRDLLTNRESVFHDVVEISLGVIVTTAVAVHPVLMLVTVPVVLLQQRFVLHSQLVSEARVDAKTGLLNARTWERETATEISRAARTGAPLAILLIDIDHFKSVNDRHGHLTGDRVLRVVADTLQEQLREYDRAGRFGGEEFVVLLPDTGTNNARAVAERVRRSIAELGVPATLRAPEEGLLGQGGQEHVIHVGVTVSVGASTSATQPDGDLTDLLTAADHALYRAKSEGRNRVHLPVPQDTP